MKIDTINKIITIIIISIIVIFSMTSIVHAGEGFSDWKEQVEEFEEKGKQGAIPIDKIIEKLLPVGRALVGIASIVLVVVGAIMGVKYMLSGANEKAMLKQKLIYYVISIVLVYGAIGIFTIVVNIMNWIAE